MKIPILFTLLLACQSRMAFQGKWNGVSNIDESNPIRALDGLFAAYSLDLAPLKLSPCLTDLEAISLELSRIVTSIEHPTFTSLFTILRQLELALKDLPSTISECMEELKPKLNEITKAFQVIRSSQSVQYHEDFALIVSGVDIFQDIQNIQVNLMVQKWYKAGYTIGTMLKKFH